MRTTRLDLPGCSHPRCFVARNQRSGKSVRWGGAWAVHLSIINLSIEELTKVRPEQSLPFRGQEATLRGQGEEEE